MPSVTVQRGQVHVASEVVGLPTVLLAQKVTASPIAADARSRAA
jgi:hypothetical protein